jgi:hypothetical protein
MLKVTDDFNLQLEKAVAENTAAVENVARLEALVSALQGEMASLEAAVKDREEKVSYYLAQLYLVKPTAEEIAEKEKEVAYLASVEKEKEVE